MQVQEQVAHIVPIYSVKCPNSVTADRRQQLRLGGGHLGDVPHGHLEPRHWDQLALVGLHLRGPDPHGDSLSLACVERGLGRGEGEQGPPADLVPFRGVGMQNNIQTGRVANLVLLEDEGRQLKLLVLPFHPS